MADWGSNVIAPGDKFSTSGVSPAESRNVHLGDKAFAVDKASGQQAPSSLKVKRNGAWSPL